MSLSHASIQGGLKVDIFGRVQQTEIYPGYTGGFSLIWRQTIDISIQPFNKSQNSLLYNAKSSLSRYCKQNLVAKIHILQIYGLFEMKSAVHLMYYKMITNLSNELLGLNKTCADNGSKTGEKTVQSSNQKID